ncbi:MAG: family 78 glycoside hydrolase catalytic domain [Ginsengibacter sp.]
MKHRILLISLFIFSFIQVVNAASSLQPFHLTCEYLENPLGLDMAKPRLSWNFLSAGRNQSQSAYEIIVSDNEKNTRSCKGNIWETDKISSDQNIQIEFSGRPLKSFTKYFWRVRVYDNNGTASSWSTTATFETAALLASDWQAKWIGDGRKNPEKDEDYYKEDRMPLIRKEFVVPKKIAQARLYISGLGYYEMFLNGQKIGDHVLDPGFTTYKKQVMYVVYDITPSLHNGRNVAGIMLGSGWWNPLPMKIFGRFDLRKIQETGRPCVKAEIHLKYSDGTSENIVTDEKWETAPGPITQNNVYLGEKYDARLEQKNWNKADANKDSWRNAVIVNGPSGILTVQMQPAIKITKVINAVKITEPSKDTFIVDMGQNFAGVAHIKVNGAAGTKITLRYGEDVWKDGSLNYWTSVATQIKKGGIKGGPGAPETAWQEDVYTLKGKGIEEWNPRFTFHGFRYVEITGWPGKPSLADIEGLRMNSDLPLNGTFSCSNTMFTKLHEVIQWTFLSNVFSVQSDCPAREKMGYGADMVVSANSFIYNYNMAGFYRKAVNDFANEQQPDGGITEIAPYTGIADRGYGGESGPLGWELGFSFLQKQLYDYYGDKRIIADNYEALARQISFLQTKAVDDLFYWDISDHEALDTKPESFSASLFYYHHAKLAEEFAGILGKNEESLKYARLASGIKDAIVARYYIKNTGRFDNATQSAQILALWYDVSPQKDATIKILMNEFERHNWHLSTGIFSTMMMFDVLRENNMNNIAYRIADQRDYPGWGNMLLNGATTLWETWAFPESDPSQNHPMFGSVDEWFYKSLLGINNAAPAFKKIVIKPHPGELTWGKGSYQSMHGEIKSDWKNEPGEFQLKTAIPVNTTAEIWLPAKEGEIITESGNINFQSAGLKLLRYEKGYAVFATGSGEYDFIVKH